MNLFSISLSGFGEERLTQLHDALQGAVNRLHKNKKLLEWKLGHSELACVAKKDFNKNKLYETVAAELAEFMISHLQGDILSEWIRKDYHTMDSRQQDKLKTYCIDLLVDSELEDQLYAEDQNKKKELADGFYEYLQANEKLHLQGYIRFRLKKYLQDLRAFLDYAVEEFIIDRQYQDFIALLKYFVCEQEARRPAVHIYHQKDNEFIVLDEKYRPIDTGEMDGLVVETIDKEINLEDMIISTLITVSPKMVYIHTKEPDMQVIRTIKLIFEERAVLCP